MNERKVVAALDKLKIPSVVVSYEDEDVDGEVAVLGTNLLIQCGRGYFIANEWKDETTMVWHGEAGNVQLIALLVRSLVKSPR